MHTQFTRFFGITFLALYALSVTIRAGDPDCQSPCPTPCTVSGSTPTTTNESESCVDIVLEYGRKEDGCCDTAQPGSTGCRKCYARVRMYLSASYDCLGGMPGEANPSGTKNECGGSAAQAIPQGGPIVVQPGTPTPEDPNPVTQSDVRIVEVTNLKCGCTATVSLTMAGASPQKSSSVTVTCAGCGG